MSIDRIKDAHEALEAGYFMVAAKLLEQAIEQAEKQEPAFYVIQATDRFGEGYEQTYWEDPAGFPVYTAPPQREWVGLTDEERGMVVNANFGIGVWEMARAIEAKLKEKNIKNTLEPQTLVKESFHKEWIGLDPEQMRNTPIEFNRGALWAERWLKEKNQG